MSSLTSSSSLLSAKDSRWLNENFPKHGSKEKFQIDIGFKTLADKSAEVLKASFKLSHLEPNSCKLGLGQGGGTSTEPEPKVSPRVQALNQSDAQHSDSPSFFSCDNHSRMRGY